MEPTHFFRRAMKCKSKWPFLLVIIIASCIPTQPELSKRTVSTESLPVLKSSEAGLSSACLGCHASYTSNHHPVDFRPADSSKISLPLFHGEIQCLTCHEEDHRGGTNCLRGGPYAERREICFKCHSEEEYAEIDPHIMLDSEGKIATVNGKPICLVCHAVQPNPVTDRTEDVKFRADVAFLCWRCHAPMVNSVLMNHFRLKPSISQLRYLQEKIEQLEVTIPLIPRQRITCSTCHNPHQEGVIMYQPSAKGADSPSRLRLPAPSLCLVCHIV